MLEKCVIPEKNPNRGGGGVVEDMEFPVLFQGRKLIFSRISKDKVKNLKIPGVFSEKYISSTPSVWIFSGIAQ